MLSATADGKIMKEGKQPRAGETGPPYRFPIPGYWLRACCCWRWACSW